MRKSIAATRRKVPDHTQELKSFILKRMDDLGVSQLELSNRSGLSQGLISNILRNNTKSLRLDTASKILSALGAGINFGGPMSDEPAGSNGKKRKHYLTRQETQEVKALLRDALDLPYKSRARGEMLNEIAKTYNVSRSVLYKVVKTVRRSPARSVAVSPHPDQKPSATEFLTAAMNEEDKKYQVSIPSMPGVVVVADDKESLISALRKIL